MSPSGQQKGHKDVALILENWIGRIENTRETEEFRRSLKIFEQKILDMGISNLTTLEMDCIGHILKGQNCAIISRHTMKDDNKLLTCFLPVSTKVWMNKDCVPPPSINERPDGPLALILIPNEDNLMSVLQPVKGLIRSLFDEKDSRKKRKFLYVVSNNNKCVRKDLSLGVDIMVTTPSCLLEMIRQDRKYLSWNRLEILVCVDSHILLTCPSIYPFQDFLEYITHEMHNLGHRALGIALQIIFYGTELTTTLEDLIKNVVDDTVVIRESRLPVKMMKTTWMEELSPQKIMCPTLLTFGQCGYLEEGCLYAHNFCPLENNLIRKGLQVKVFITKCENVSNYLGRLYGCFDHGNFTEYLPLWNFRCQLLKSYYRVKENRIPMTKFHLNKMVAVEVDNLMLRATIQEIVRRDSRNRPKSIRLFCVDRGHQIIRSVKDTEFFHAPSKYEQLPQFGVRVILVGLKPNTGLEYDQKVIASARDMTEGKVITGKIIELFGNSIYLDPQFQDGRNLRKECLKKNLGTENNNTFFYNLVHHF